jgi:dipeptidyl aminopeptidase/acylaminoacyl peptidase
LIEHHEGDLRCPIGQGDEVFQTLKLLGKEAEYLRYPGGSHEGGPPSQDVDYMCRQIAWFDGHGGRSGGSEEDTTGVGAVAIESPDREIVIR